MRIWQTCDRSWKKADKLRVLLVLGINFVGVIRKLQPSSLRCSTGKGLKPLVLKAVVYFIHLKTAIPLPLTRVAVGRPYLQQQPTPIKAPV